MRTTNGKPLRVLLVAACPFPCARGGAARVLGQALALQQRGVDVSVVTYDLAEFESPAGLPVFRIPRVPTHRRTTPGPSLQKLALLDPLLLLRAARLARRKPPQVLHGHHVEGAAIALALGRWLRIPVVFDAHTSLSEELPTYAPRWLSPTLGRAGGRIDAALTRLAAHTFAVSEALRAELLSRAGVAAERVSVVPMGLEDGALASSCPPPKPPSGPSTLVYAGGLSGFQRLDLLGRAYELVRRELPEVRLRIVSPDPIEALEVAWPRARSCPGVHWSRPGAVAEGLMELDGADVALCPRTGRGGFPQKILNYMARGLPVVACQGGAGPLRHGESGWVVPDDDVQAFAAGILALLRDPALRGRLGATARRAAEGFTWNRVVEPMLGVYRRLADGTPAARPGTLDR
ncbi:MAG: glycosyltransferase family 4 protein [Myxococcota bacterium]